MLHSQFIRLSLKDKIVLVETGSDKALEGRKNMVDELVMLRQCSMIIGSE